MCVCVCVWWGERAGFGQTASWPQRAAPHLPEEGPPSWVIGCRYQSSGFTPHAPSMWSVKLLPREGEGLALHSQNGGRGWKRLWGREGNSSPGAGMLETICEFPGAPSAVRLEPRVARRAGRAVTTEASDPLLLLQLLLSRFSRVWLCATPWTAAHQAPLSMGFSRQGIGVGCHFLLQCMPAC